MKNSTIKQFIVTALFICLCATAFAQGVEVCTGTPYTITNAEAATTDSYRWTENGKVISGAVAAEYTVPNTKAAGVYTYVRQSKSAECDDWTSSNEITVAVFTCSVTVGAGAGSTATYVDSRDGQSYKIVRMPDNKIWFAQNLNYTKGLYYNDRADQANGTQFITAGSGVSAVGSYWCPTANGSVASGGQSMCAIYGALYTWETAMMVDGKYADEAKTSSAWVEPSSGNYFTSGAPASTPGAKLNNARGTVVANSGGRGICPTGWRVPTDYEWANLSDKVDNTTVFTTQTSAGSWVGTNSPGAKLKSTATYTPTDLGNGSWLDHANRGTNTTGFGAVPAGHRNNDGSMLYNRGLGAYYWSSSVYSSTNAWRRVLDSIRAQVYCDNYNRSYGYSVRCVRD